MVADPVEVRIESIEKLRLPRVFTEGALLMFRLASRGVLAEAAQRVRVERQGGFCGVDALVYLVLFFVSMPKSGLRAMWGAIGEAGGRLAALAGRDAVMSRSALSRLLGVVEVAEVDRFARWLLLEASGVIDVMRQQVARIVDTQGAPRRVFAFDPVRIGIRHRGLPDGADLPPPNRRTRRLGAPGRTGRKRGEVVSSAGVLEDLGSTAVLDVQLSPGNGDVRQMFARAIEAVLATLSSLQESLADAILLADGEFGSVPYLSMCTEAGLAAITRSSRYELLDDPAIWTRLREARWERVEDSRSGPVRYAAEVGTVLIPPNADTRRDDGSPYSPVEVRLVVSRYSAAQGSRGCGRLIDGFRYELFVSIGVSPSSFPAPDVVALFYARCGQECSFQQQQRDLAIQRVHSTNPGGQLFAWVVALFVWNLRLRVGMELSPPLPARSAPSPRRSTPADPPELPTHLLADASAETDQPEPAPTTPSPAPDATAQPPDLDALDVALAQVNWSHWLRRRRGCSWDPVQRSLVTAEGLRFRFTSVEWCGHRAKLRFIGVGHKKQATVAVPPHLARAIAAAQGRLTPAPGEDHGEERAPDSRALSTRLIAPATDDERPPYSVGWPELLRANARKVLSKLADDVEIAVRLPRSRPARPAHPLVEPLRARRQHRRLTWDERLARHAAPGRPKIRVTTSSDMLAVWLRDPPSDLQATRPTM
jgi:hypothetical protein